MLSTMTPSMVTRDAMYMGVIIAEVDPAAASQFWAISIAITVAAVGMLQHRLRVISTIGLSGSRRANLKAKLSGMHAAGTMMSLHNTAAMVVRRAM